MDIFPFLYGKNHCLISVILSNSTMMKHFARLLFPGFLIILFTSGCASITKGPTQRVQINSEPSGARILQNGQTVGITPETLTLSRKRGHSFTIEKAGFKPETVTFLTVPNKPADAFIRFGIDDTFGAHNDLTPESASVELQPAILPDEPGDNPFAELAAKIVEVDEQLARRQISAEDHRYILSRLFEFYQP